MSAGISENRKSAALIVMAGNIGTGKTTLATRLASDLGLTLQLERVTDNPYLQRFYADMAAWTFHLNMFFLASRAQQLLHASRSRMPSIFDRSLYEDEIYARIAHEAGHTSPEEFATFCELEQVLSATLPRPDLLIYLSASTDCLMDRLTRRARSFEDGIDRADVDLLQARYEAWIERYEASPVLRVDSERVQLHGDSPEFDAIVRAVKAVLELPACGDGE